MNARLTNGQPTTVKDSNPKDVIGSRKPRSFISLSWYVIRELSLALLEGALKYGRHNYRYAGVRASVYTDAAINHIVDFQEGQDIDPESGISHITKAMASLHVLRDAMINGSWVDDRPLINVGGEAHKHEMQGVMDALIARYPEPVKPYMEVDRGKPRT